MKISLTINEIKELISQKYCVQDFDLEITDSAVVSKTEEEPEWISNVGRGACGHPDSLDDDTRIEVQFRNDVTGTGKASNWNTSWRETDGLTIDIVAYRILK